MSEIYYHFTGSTLRDGRPIPPIGEWLTHEGDVVMCESGLHASQQPFDALQYAPGQMLHQVELEGIVDTHSDKVVAKRRKIIATIDATQLLRLFARKQALSVIHLWDCPAIVKEYLETGAEDKRDAARGAALGAARGAARGAALGAAWDAARDAAWGAAVDAALDAAWGAALDAAWAAALGAARQQFNEMVESEFAAVTK